MMATITLTINYISQILTRNNTILNNYNNVNFEYHLPN